MAHFSNPSYDVAGYAASRPTYPPVLLDIVLRHHLRGKPVGEGRTKALDLGCGPGQVTQMLPSHFREVVGIDPSGVMIDQAKQLNSASNVTFVLSRAEDIATQIDADSIDLVIAGEAAQWFDHERVWPALAHVLKPAGTMAYWVYGQPRIFGHPELTPLTLIDEYCNSDKGLGPWRQPATKLLLDLYTDIVFPTSEEWDSNSRKRIYFTGDSHFPDLKLPSYPLPLSDADDLSCAEEEFRTDTILLKTMNWAQVEGWWKTLGALDLYLERYPEEKARSGRGKDGDILDRFIYQLKERLGTDEVTLEWPMAVMMIKKRTT